MNELSILEHLNDAQKKAVTATTGHYLILAGAGSGKTTVLVRRIAWLLEVQSLSPYRILAVTFTNKAAQEMRARVDQSLGFKSTGLSIGTFHSIAHKMLRRHWQEANLQQNFQIIDTDDQLRLVKRVLKNLNLDDKKWVPRSVQGFINANKEEGFRPDKLSDNGDYIKKTHIRIYTEYQLLCEQSNLIDFSELLLRTFELLQDHPELLLHYQSKFQAILVDEFQDTNNLQYAWIRLLSGENTSLYIVGDDDQSIYGWRGAQVGNIHKFCQDFPTAKTIRLEQNYRSTGNILKAANEVIANNVGRLGKKLWTTDGEGEPISLYSAFNEIDEARFIASQIHRWAQAGNRLAEVAILYRSNAQSRILEEAFIQAKIPYRIYGGLRFFERQEIKDALAYLRLMMNRDDDAAFERVINTPARGIGEKTLEALRTDARDKNTSLFTAVLLGIEHQRFTSRTLNHLLSFVRLIHGLEKQTEALPLDEQIKCVIHETGLMHLYENEKGDRAQARIENLQELIAAAKAFSPDPESGLSPLTAFLTHAALESGEGQSQDFTDAIQLMTLHSAKGLEFPLVFMVGVEEGLFPHYLSAQDASKVEEERRLCYVGMTRAMKKLYITFAETRRIYGSESRNKPSRFLLELPAECIQEVRMNTKIIKTHEATKLVTHAFKTQNSPYQLGQLVTHPTFGEGVILNQEGNQEHLRLQIKFQHAGTKWLVAAYAKLTVVSQ